MGVVAQVQPGVRISYQSDAAFLHAEKDNAHSSRGAKEILAGDAAFTKRLLQKWMANMRGAVGLPVPHLTHPPLALMPSKPVSAHTPVPGETKPAPRGKQPARKKKTGKTKPKPGPGKAKPAVTNPELEAEREAILKSIGPVSDRDRGSSSFIEIAEALPLAHAREANPSLEPVLFRTACNDGRGFQR